MNKALLILIIGLCFGSSVSGQMFKKDSQSSDPSGFLAVPTLNYNRSLGLEIGAIAMYFNQFGKNDTISPPSVSGIKGFWTTNKSWFVFAFQRMFFKEDNWRVTWALGTGDINFQFYTDDVPGGAFIDYTTTRSFFALTVTRRVYSRFYMGLDVKYTRLNTAFYLGDNIGNVDSLKHLVGVGIPLAWDSRDNIFNPKKGIESRLIFHFNNKIFGSDLDFNTINFMLNYYKRVTQNGVIACRAHIYYGLGEVPFEGTRAVGKNDIRGYTKGGHRGEQVASLQSEYRGRIKNKWGYVGFIGLAAAFNTTEHEQWSGVLPAVGVGVRFLVIPAKKINLGIDAAVGLNDWGVYFRIGEAF